MQTSLCALKFASEKSGKQSSIKIFPCLHLNCKKIDCNWFALLFKVHIQNNPIQNNPIQNSPKHQKKVLKTVPYKTVQNQLNFFTLIVWRRQN